MIGVLNTMGKELTLDIVQSQLRPKQRHTISQETVDEIKKLSEDIDYGEEFLELYLDHLNVFKESKSQNHKQYLNALKFFSLVEGGNSLTDAYIKVFPERYEQRKKHYPPSEQKKSLMRHDANRFNNSGLVTEIKRVATIPVQLVHRHLLHEAILNQAELMRSARSEMVRQKAGATLIAELKPPEESTVNVKVDDNTASVVEQLRRAAENLAEAEYKGVRAGVPLKDIAEATIIYEEDNSKEEQTGE